MRTTYQKHLMATLAALLATGCSPDQDAYNEASAANSREAYEQFLSDYPDSELRQDAKALMQLIPARQVRDTTWMSDLNSDNGVCT